MAARRVLAAAQVVTHVAAMMVMVVAVKIVTMEAETAHTAVMATGEHALALLVALDASQLLLDPSLLALHLFLLRLIQGGELLDERVVLGVADLEVSVDDGWLAYNFHAREFFALRIAEGTVNFEHATRLSIEVRRRVFVLVVFLLILHLFVVLAAYF